MRRKEIDQKFDEIIDFSGVERFIDTPVKRYSTGMSVRLAFAVAAHLEPETLLVDEVLAVGDISFQQKCLAKMGDVARGGATVLFVSHNMGTVSTLCNTVILLKDGQLDSIGPTRQIISDYLASAGADGGLSREWSYEDAPTCSQGKIKSINITNQAGVQDPFLPCSEPVVVNIEYWITKNEGLPVNVGIWLFDNQGQSICSSGNIENARARTETMPGLYRSSCTIPGGLLNSGRHSITVGLYSDVSLNPLNGTRQLVLDLPQCVSFETVDDDSFQTNYDNWAGAIKPNFPWKTTFTLDAETIAVAD
jgi:lipopolysaccharide transport system ATP-binding protein